MNQQQPANVEPTFEERLRRLEDHQAIGRIVARYGPAVDSASATEVAELWTEGGTYTFGMGEDTVTLQGRRGLSEMVFGSGHQAIIMGGSGHFQSAPYIEITGDSAVATGYSMLVRHDGSAGRFYVDRLAANRWVLSRTDQGWQVTERTNRLLDGQPAARELLSDAVRKAP